MAKAAVLDIVIEATSDKAVEAFDKVKEKASGLLLGVEGGGGGGGDGGGRRVGGGDGGGGRA